MYKKEIEKENLFSGIVGDAIVFSFPKDVEGDLDFVIKNLRDNGLYPYKVLYKDEQAKREVEKEGFVFHFVVFCLKIKVYEC